MNRWRLRGNEGKTPRSGEAKVFGAWRGKGCFQRRAMVKVNPFRESGVSKETAAGEREVGKAVM